MSENLVPGTVIKYPNPDYRDYTAPPDVMAINTAYLVDSEFRQMVRAKQETGISVAAFNGSGKEEAHYADIAKKRLGISFGTDYKLPQDVSPAEFQLYIFKCCHRLKLEKGTATEDERQNVRQIFDTMKKLNPTEFKKLEGLNLTDVEKFDVALGATSKFSMEDIAFFIKSNRAGKTQDFVPGIDFVMSDETKSKLNGVLGKHNASLDYYNYFAVGSEWQTIPDQNLWIVSLLRHDEKTIKSAMRTNPEMFFSAIEQSTSPTFYAGHVFDTFFAGKRMASQVDISVLKRLMQIKNRDGKGDALRQGVSKVLGFMTRTLPAMRGRKFLKEKLVKGYRYLYPKGWDR